MTYNNRNTKHGQRGFTLIELLVVLVILGLLAGLVGPQILRYLGSAKSDTAQLQIAELGAGLDLFHLEVGRYPTTDEGLAALVATGILERLPLRGLDPDSPDAVHFQVEAMKAGLSVAYRHVADPDHMTADAADFLDTAFLDGRAASIRPDPAGELRRIGQPPEEGVAVQE